MKLRPVIVAVSAAGLPKSAASVVDQRRRAREALLLSAEGSGAPREGWRQDSAGAPLPNAGYFWSISHKPRWAGAVISDGPVGIDLEQITPRRDTLWQAAGRPDEWTLLGGVSWTAFHRLWTAKEAVLKANGLGIGHLDECRLADEAEEFSLRLLFRGVVWPVAQFFFEDHVAAVAAQAGEVGWTVIPEAATLQDTAPPQVQPAG